MSTYSKPSVLPAWGESNTTSADMVQPDNGSIQTGWPLSTIPPARQIFNWVLNWLANGMRYFMQRGLVDYDAAETYGLNARVIGDDGNTYCSLKSANTGHTPSTSPTYWTLWGHTATQLSTALSPLAPKAGPVFTGQVILPEGSVNSPGLSFTNDGGYNTGFYHIADDRVGVTCGSTEVVEFNISGAQLLLSPTAPTPASSDNSTHIANTAFVQGRINDVTNWVIGQGYATVAWINGLGLATQAWVAAQGYATVAWVNSLGLATQAWVNGLGYATVGWVESWVTSLGYATTAWVTSLGYATQAWCSLGLQFSLSGGGGYVAFPRWLTGGTQRLVIKWGIAVSNGSHVSFDTTVPFSAMPAIFTTCNGAASYYTGGSSVGLNVVSMNSDDPYVNWLAIGYSAS